MWDLILSVTSLSARGDSCVRWSPALSPSRRDVFQLTRNIVKPVSRNNFLARDLTILRRTLAGGKAIQPLFPKTTRKLSKHIKFIIVHCPTRLEIGTPLSSEKNYQVLCPLLAEYSCRILLGACNAKEHCFSQHDLNFRSASIISLGNLRRSCLFAPATDNPRTQNIVLNTVAEARPLK